MFLKQNNITCVSTNDTSESGNEVAFVQTLEYLHSENPASHPPSEAVSFLRVSIQLLKNCAKAGTVKQLFKAVKWKLYAGSRGAISKDECPDWAMLVLYGFAREGKTHIHLETLDLGGDTFLFKAEYLNQNPVVIAAWIITAFFLNIAKIGGRTIESRKAHLRLVSNLDCGGMCNDLLAAAFNRTKSWASKMRRQLEQAGLCTYKRRLTVVSKEEGDIANLIGEGDRYIRTGAKCGKYLRERVSECITISEPEFKSPWMPRFKPDGNDLESYLKRKGRVCA